MPSFSPATQGAASTLSERSPSEIDGRCGDIDADGGQCQLVFGHQSVHAASVPDAYLTWERGEVFRWSAWSPPGWLISLYWVPEFQPTMPDTPPLPLF